MPTEDFPQDGSTCCNQEPSGEFGRHGRCPHCKHFLTFIYTNDPSDGALNCTWPDCVTNE